MAAKVIYGSKPLEYFKADEAAATAPSVDFGNIAPGAAPAAAPAANDNAAPASTATPAAAAGK
jgi:LemA protein